MLGRYHYLKHHWMFGDYRSSCGVYYGETGQEICRLRLTAVRMIGSIVVGFSSHLRSKWLVI